MPELTELTLRTAYWPLVATSVNWEWNRKHRGAEGGGTRVPELGDTGTRVPELTELTL